MSVGISYSGREYKWLGQFVVVIILVLLEFFL